MPVCNMCGDEFDDQITPGALFFGCPGTGDYTSLVMKAHICHLCAAVIIEGFSIPFTKSLSDHGETALDMEWGECGAAQGTVAEGKRQPTTTSCEISHLWEHTMPQVTQSREVTYAIGTEDRENGIGFHYGPTPILREMQELTGASDRDVIVRFNGDGTNDIMFRWRQGMYDNFEWMPEVGLKKVCPSTSKDDSGATVYCCNPLNHDRCHEASNE